MFSKKNAKNNKREEIKINNDSPFMPSENAFRNFPQYMKDLLQILVIIILGKIKIRFKMKILEIDLIIEEEEEGEEDINLQTIIPI